MLKRIFLASTILLFLTTFFASATKVVAQDVATDISQTNNEILTEFCERRQGGIINLETWYAGQCDPEGETSSFSGPNLGFGDIIILHVYELLAGEQSAGTQQEIIDKIFGVFKVRADAGEKLDYFTLLEILGSTPQTLSNDTGIVPQLGYLVGTTLSHPPVRSTEYIASVRQNMAKHKLVKPAYAQGNAAAQGGGYGFANFQGFLSMWRAFRNISYFFFVLAFVAYGFAIMFRVKLGQAAITIQAALPKLITTLLIITFSYAIVGFLIDVMWVLYYLLLNALDAFGVFGTSINVSTHLLARALSGDLGLFVSAIFQSVIGFFFALPAAISAILGVPALATYAVTVSIGFFTGGTVFLILAIIFLVAVLLAFAKLLIKLITAYVSIIGNLVLAPLILLPDAIPGQGGAFNRWINNLIANIVVFPVTSILLLFSGFFMLQPIIDLINSGLGSVVDVVSVGATPVALVPISSDTPPRVPLLNPNIPVLTGESSGSNWMALIGLTLLLMSPKFVDMIKGAFNVKPLQLGLGDVLLLGGGIEKGISTQISNQAGAAYNAATGNISNQFAARRAARAQQNINPQVQQRLNLFGRRQGNNPNP